MSLIVSLGFIQNGESVLLIRRENQTYNDMLALPGGKVKEEEHKTEAVKREIKEESGLECEIKKFHGIVSEKLYKDGVQDEKFILSVFELEPQNTELQQSEEGTVGWYNIADVTNQIIPSDLKILNTVIDSDQYYFNCKISGTDLTYFQTEHGDIE